MPTAPTAARRSTRRWRSPCARISVPAYAKLNLTLDILGKRDDGYHEMKMVMQTISLHDYVTVTLTDKGITCRIAGAELPCDERNLAVKAANAFCEAMDYRGGIDITLTKRIPSEAGMAGGGARTGRRCCAHCAILSPPRSRTSGSSRSVRVSAATFPSASAAAQLAEGRGEKLTVLNRYMLSTGHIFTICNPHRDRGEGESSYCAMGSS